MEPKDPEAPIFSPTSLPSTRWWSKETVAVVTGANKGIGFALVRRLAEVGLTVILTARDEGKGLKAVESLRGLGLHVQFWCLDVSDQGSIKAFASWFADRDEKLDILVNNAAVSFNDIHENSVDHAEEVIRTNFYGPKLLIQTLLPFFHYSSPTQSRILNISSRLGLLNKLRNSYIKEKLQNAENLSEEQIDGVVKQFLEDVKGGAWKSRGWPGIWTDYSISKLALNAYSKLLAKRFEGRGLSINCFCPGFTQTSMTKGKGTHTADVAAEMGSKIALLPPKELPNGGFFLGSTRCVYSKL